MPYPRKDQPSVASGPPCNTTLRVKSGTARGGGANVGMDNFTDRSIGIETLRIKFFRGRR